MPGDENGIKKRAGEESVKKKKRPDKGVSHGARCVLILSALCAN